MEYKKYSNAWTNHLRWHHLILLQTSWQKALSFIISMNFVDMKRASHLIHDQPWTWATHLYSDMGYMVWLTIRQIRPAIIAAIDPSLILSPLIRFGAVLYHLCPLSSIFALAASFYHTKQKMQHWIAAWLNLSTWWEVCKTSFSILYIKNEFKCKSVPNMTRGKRVLSSDSND